MRGGCEQHQEFSALCLQCWYIENSRMRKALELILEIATVEDAWSSSRTGVHGLAIKALKGENVKGERC